MNNDVFGAGFIAGLAVVVAVWLVSSIFVTGARRNPTNTPDAIRNVYQSWELYLDDLENMDRLKIGTKD